MAYGGERVMTNFSNIYMFFDLDGNVVDHDDPYVYIATAFGIGGRIVDVMMRHYDAEDFQTWESVTLSHDICCVEDVLEAVAAAIGLDDRETV